MPVCNISCAGPTEAKLVAKDLKLASSRLVLFAVNDNPFVEQVRTIGVMPRISNQLILTRPLRCIEARSQWACSAGFLY